MARRKNRPEAVEEKSRVSTRMREIRIELFGERGGSEMARRLGIPVRTWYNYESGVTVPAEVLLRFLELTHVEPVWLLHGRGPKYRRFVAGETSTDEVRQLLRTALDHLAARGSFGHDAGRRGLEAGHPSSPDATTRGPIPSAGVPRPVQAAFGDETGSIRRLLGQIPEPSRCVRVEGSDMVPVLADGAYVAFAEASEPLDALRGRLVVAWIEGRAIVRWLDVAGRYVILRAENPNVPLVTILTDSIDQDPHGTRIRRALWTNTPHG
jgi:transcriptional regulator with XRE-family HTH domain